jgi:outer membrane protein TolC
VTFDVAVKRALDRNPTAKIADAEIQRARALMQEVRASSLPTLNAIGTYTKLDHERLSNGVVALPGSSLNANVTLTAPLIYPRGWVQWSQAGDQIDVARANAADVRRTLAVTTARAYITVLTQKRLRETAITARDNAKAHFEFTRAQLVGGIGNRLDEVRAAQELTTDEVNLQNQEVALVRAREALGVLVAGDGAVDCDEQPTQAAMPTLAEATNGSQTDRADVVALKRASKAADRTVDNAWADYMPYLDLIAFPFYQNPAYTTVPRTGWEAQLVLTVPLYDGGYRYGQERTSRRRCARRRATCARRSTRFSAPTSRSIRHTSPRPSQSKRSISRTWRTTRGRRRTSRSSMPSAKRAIPRARRPSRRTRRARRASISSPRAAASPEPGRPAPPRGSSFGGRGREE